MHLGPDQFLTPTVRDLAWTIVSPPLLDSDYPHGAASVSPAWCEQAYAALQPWLAQLDREPAPLIDWLARQQGRLLGRHFERLIEFWLRHWPGVRFLGAQEQVRLGERAVGEFDFLFLDHDRGRAVHWEAAVKFYLRHGRPDGGFEWLGPNPRDTLAKKLHKVFQHQLRMVGRPEAQPVLQRLGIASLQPEAFIKGYLFYPAEGDWQHPEAEPGGIPAGVAASHLKGWWTSAGDRCIPEGGPESRWVVLERLAWLAPARAAGTRPGLGREARDRLLDEHFAHSHKPLLLAELLPASDGTWREASRGFVAPVRWPRL